MFPFLRLTACEAPPDGQGAKSSACAGNGKRLAPGGDGWRLGGLPPTGGRAAHAVRLAVGMVGDVKARDIPRQRRPPIAAILKFAVRQPIELLVSGGGAPIHLAGREPCLDPGREQAEAAAFAVAGGPLRWTRIVLGVHGVLRSGVLLAERRAKRHHPRRGWLGAPAWPLRCQGHDAGKTRAGKTVFRHASSWRAGKARCSVCRGCARRLLLSSTWGRG